MIIFRAPDSGRFTSACRSFFSNFTATGACLTQSGQSLMDMLVTIGIIGIIAGMSTAIIGLVSSHATTAEVNGLMADLAFSRLTAINTRTTVTLCASDDGLTCKKTSPWSRGWMIFTDENRNRVIDDDDRLLRVQDGLSPTSRLEYGSGYYRYLMYNPSGQVFPGATFRFCAGDNYQRAIIVYWTGRPRVSHVASGGEPLVCPPS